MNTSCSATPSGLPALEFREPGDGCDTPPTQRNDLTTILTAGVWYDSAGGSAFADRVCDCDWPMQATARRLSPVAVLAWWESRRLLFNALLLTAAVPGGLLLLMISWIRVTVFQMVSGPAPFAVPADFTVLVAALVALNCVYTALSWADLAIRLGARVGNKQCLGMWQSCVMLGLVSIAFCFFATAACALGAH